MDKIVGDDAVVHSFALLSTYGDVVTSSQLSASEGDVIFDVTVAKVAASMVGMMDRGVPFQFQLRDSCYSGVSLHRLPFFVLISASELSHGIILKTLQLAHTMSQLFQPELREMGELLEARSLMDLHKSTYHDTAESGNYNYSDDIFLQHEELFSIFQEHYVRELLSKADGNFNVGLPLQRALDRCVRTDMSTTISGLKTASVQARQCQQCVGDMYLCIYTFEVEEASSHCRTGMTCSLSLAPSCAPSTGCPTCSAPTSTSSAPSIILSPQQFIKATGIPMFACDMLSRIVNTTRETPSSLDSFLESHVLWCRRGECGSTLKSLTFPDHTATSTSSLGDWAIILHILPQLSNMMLIAPVPSQLLVLSGEGCQSIADVVPRNLLNAWMGTLKRFYFLFPSNLKQLSLMICDYECHLSAKTGSKEIVAGSAAEKVLSSLLVFEAPLPGDVGAIRPSRPLDSRPPEAGHFKRHSHLRSAQPLIS